MLPQKRRVFLIVAIVLILTLICIVIFKWCNTIKFDQETDMDRLITKKHSVSDIEKLRTAASWRNMYFADFKKDFKVQCARKTHQGFYVVLLMEDGRHAFVCFNNEELLYRVLLASNFKSKEDFQNNVMLQMSMSEVLEYDSNIITTHSSANIILIHIVQGGYFIVRYDNPSQHLAEDPSNPSEPCVSAIEFYENDSLVTGENQLAKLEEVPFIYEIDKK